MSNHDQTLDQKQKVSQEIQLEGIIPQPTAPPSLPATSSAAVASASTSASIAASADIANEAAASHHKKVVVDISPSPSTASNEQASNDGDTTSNGKAKKAKEKKPSVPFLQLFRYADSLDILLMITGTCAAMANGAVMPSFSIIFGQLINSFNPTTNGTISPETFEYNITYYACWFTYIGIVALGTATLEISCWMIAGERQSSRMREMYIQSILRHEQAWVDGQGSGKLIAHLTNDSRLYGEAIGEKIGACTRFYSTFVAGLIIGLVYSWQLTLVIIAVTPLLGICGAAMATVMQKGTTASSAAYADANQVASEAVTNIRTVQAFGQEHNEGKRYDKLLYNAFKTGVKAGWLKGASLGFVMLVIFCVYGLALWYGSTLVRDGKYNGGEITAAFFAVIMGSFALGQGAPYLPAIASGQAAAYILYSVIDRQSAIDSLDETHGIKPDATAVQGRWEFKDVKFAYETRADQTVLEHFNLRIPPGKVVALVGQSGSGKSTVVSLLQRLYDPIEGSILLDGVDLRDYNVRWLRSQQSVVSQEPILFSDTIRNNILLGKTDASDSEIEEAAAAASASKFIDAFPQKYNTKVGERGSSLSGGQKQRIALARAFITSPKLLLLDESTSALDQKTEAKVQAAIQQYIRRRQCSVLVVAHRLSTIKDADQIVTMDKGQIVEVGTHDELMEKRGTYWSLVVTQANAAKEALRHSRDNSHDDTPSAKDGAVNDSSDDDLTAPKQISVVIDVDAGKAMNGNLDNSKPKLAAPQKASTSSRDKESYVKATPARSEAKADQTAASAPIKRAPLKRMYLLSRDHWGWLLLGVCSALIVGGSFPALSQLLSQMINVFYKPLNQIESAAALIAGLFAIIGLGIGAAHMMQAAALAVAGEHLTLKLRSMSFMQILRMHIAWHGQPSHNSGLLTAKLATEAGLVQGLTTGPIQQFVQLVALIAAGLGLAFFYQPIMAGVLLSCVPLIAGANYVMMRFIAGFSSKSKEAIERSASVANESITHIRTVTSFNAQYPLLKAFMAVVDENKRIGYRTAVTTGLGFGASQFTLFTTYTLGFWFGGQLVGQGKASFSEILNVFFAITMASMGAGQASSFAPDYKKATTAANAITDLLDSKSLIDPEDTSGSPINVATSEAAADGGSVEIDFQNIYFTYPSRPDLPIFNDFSLRIPRGKTIALVGASGSGKSTLVSLLLRFYDVDRGSILLDGRDIRTYNLQQLRSVMGLVQQEPSLFSDTIKGNIMYGKPDATHDEMVEAATGANIHDFIMTLPQQYDTPITSTSLSGGQKQRICIARCLIRKPRLLLCDEATSALDSNSEKQVEETLKLASKHCTTLIIAHRLSTIRTADLIAVIDRGQMVEMGTHDKLMEKKASYFALIHAQH